MTTDLLYLLGSVIGACAITYILGMLAERFDWLSKSRSAPRVAIDDRISNERIGEGHGSVSRNIPSIRRDLLQMKHDRTDPLKGVSLFVLHRKDDQRVLQLTRNLEAHVELTLAVVDQRSEIEVALQTVLSRYLTTYQEKSSDMIRRAVAEGIIEGMSRIRKEVETPVGLERHPSYTRQRTKALH